MSAMTQQKAAGEYQTWVLGLFRISNHPQRTRGKWERFRAHQVPSRSPPPVDHFLEQMFKYLTAPHTADTPPAQIAQITEPDESTWDARLPASLELRCAESPRQGNRVTHSGSMCKKAGLGPLLWWQPLKNAQQRSGMRVCCWLHTVTVPLLG